MRADQVETQRDHPAGGPAEWSEDLWDDSSVLPDHVVERLPRNRRWLRWFLYLLGIVVLASILFAGTVGLKLAREINPTGAPSDPVTFTVNENDDLTSVAQRLEAQGIIVDSGTFEWFVNRDDEEARLVLVPGNYLLKPRDNIGDIIKRLGTPPELTFTKVVYPEGFTLRQMSRRLGESITDLNGDTFFQAASDGTVRSDIAPEITNLEGLLFPDTYEFAGNQTETDVLQTMVDLMERVGRQEDLTALAYKQGLTGYQALIVASIVEREAQTDDDRFKIARVIYNRLALGMPLEVDATLFYGQPPGTEFDVLKATDSPYNTYLYPGLPPTPIANPGRASIRAVLNPSPNPPSGDPICLELPDSDPCDYLFYVLSPANDGSHVFAATYEQHLRNVDAARAAGVL
jgi:UPF0755 protein